jgi:hypothetical protein
MKRCVVMREPASLDHRTKISHHVITIVLGTEAEVEDHDLHHQGATTVHDMKEADDPNLQGTHTITRTTKKRWSIMLYSQSSHDTSIQRIYYPAINRNTMALRNLDHGYQTTCK